MLRDLLRRRPVAMAIVLAALLTSPALFSGFFNDDVWHFGMLERRALPARGPLDLYRFADGTPGEVEAATMRGGIFSWWSEPRVRASFMRPLASALTAADHAAFGRAPLPYHVHALLWYLALVGAVGLLHRRSIGIAGGLATLLFAIDDSHAQPAGWIASRHAVVASLPVVLGLVAHLRWRQDRWRPGLVFGPLGLALGLGAGETALAAASYVLAYETVGSRDSRRVRLIAIAPYAVIALVYLAIYARLGYGVHGSGGYLDPASPGFAAAIGPRVLALCADMIAGAGVDLWLLSTALRPFLVIMGAGAIAGLALLVRKLARDGDCPDDERRALAWLALGSLLSLLPCAAGFMGSRLLLVPSIGSFAVIAWALRRGWKALRGAPRVFWGWLAFVHCVTGPLALFVGLLFLREVSWRTQEIHLGADVGPRGSHVFVLGTADPLASIYGPYWPWLLDPERPRSWHALSIAPFEHRLTRTGENSIELEVIGGRMLQSDFELVFRARDNPLPAGREVALDGSRIRVLEALDGAPTRIELTTDGSLDGETYRVLVFRDGALRRLVLPKLGESTVIPRTIGPTRL